MRGSCANRTAGGSKTAPARTRCGWRPKRSRQAREGQNTTPQGVHQTQVTGEMTALGLTGAHLLSPGVTLQYALRGKLGPRALWAMLGVVLLLFAICGVLTLGIVALVGRDALALGG